MGIFNSAAPDSLTRPPDSAYELLLTRLPPPLPSLRPPMAKEVGERSEERVVLRVAVLSRLLLLSLIAFWRLVFPPYDTSASLNPACLAAGDKSPGSNAVLWPRIGAAIEASVVWDGVYFVRIAECGYEYEQTYAFFPLLPGCIAILSRSLFAPLVPIIGYRAVLALSGYMVNNSAFLLAAVFFYRVSVLGLNDTAASLRATILFCFNPASVFYSSIYSESLYALLSLGGIYYLFSGGKIVAMLLLVLCGSSRSNGAVNAGYFCFQALRHAYDFSARKKWFRAAEAIVDGAICSLFIFLPFVSFQFYGYYNICQGGKNNLRPWCKKIPPFLYGFLQSHYWGVGFLRYFQVKQLPNFLLASPTLSLAVGSIIYYKNSLREALPPSLRVRMKNNVAPVHKSVEASESSAAVSASTSSLSFQNAQGHKMIKRREQGERKDNVSESPQDLGSLDQVIPSKQGPNLVLVCPFVLHLAFMAFTAFFVMHVQVSTRFLSASPPIYWFASYLLLSPKPSSRRWGYLICAYFASYVFLGSLLFSTFYPFT